MRGRNSLLPRLLLRRDLPFPSTPLGGPGGSSCPGGGADGGGLILPITSSTVTDAAIFSACCLAVSIVADFSVLEPSSRFRRCVDAADRRRSLSCVAPADGLGFEGGGGFFAGGLGFEGGGGFEIGGFGLGFVGGGGFCPMGLLLSLTGTGGGSASGGGTGIAIGGLGGSSLMLVCSPRCVSFVSFSDLCV